MRRVTRWRRRWKTFSRGERGLSCWRAIAAARARSELRACSLVKPMAHDLRTVFRSPGVYAWDRRPTVFRSPGVYAWDRQFSVAQAFTPGIAGQLFSVAQAFTPGIAGQLFSVAQAFTPGIASFP